MANPQHLEVVTRILAECAGARAPQMRAAHAPKIYPNEAEAWRRLVLHLASPSWAGANQRHTLERNVAEPLGRVWTRNLAEAGVKKLDLSGADLRDQVFCQSELFGQTPLNGADFRNAQLQATEWVCTALWGADFSGANLRDSYMVRAGFSRTKFHDADLSGAQLLLLGQEGADFSRANLSGARILLDTTPSWTMSDAQMDGCVVTYMPPSNPKAKAEMDKKLDAFLVGLDVTQRAAVKVERPEVKKSGMCFLATAACGSEGAAEIVCLREFRERVLRRTRMGQGFIAAYERLSPPLARYIARSSVARAAVRQIVIRPAVRLAKRWGRDLLPKNQST